MGTDRQLRSAPMYPSVAGQVHHVSAKAARAARAQRNGRALERDQNAEDLVGPVFFLASTDAGFITGQTLDVDGGMSMNPPPRRAS